MYSFNIVIYTIEAKIANSLPVASQQLSVI